MKPFMRNADKGAETAVWLATSPDVEGLSGRYYTDKKEIKSNPFLMIEDCRATLEGK